MCAEGGKGTPFYKATVTRFAIDFISLLFIHFQE